MTLVVDATPMGASANSYVTLATAVAYVEGRPGADAWNAASDADRNQALVAATSRLEQEQYYGIRTLSTQRLRWPRLGLFEDDGYFLVSYGFSTRTLDSQTVPRQVQEACIEEALAILTDPARLDISGLMQFQTLTVGSISLTPRETGVSPYQLTPAATRLLMSFRTGSVGGSFPLARG